MRGAFFTESFPFLIKRPAHGPGFKAPQFHLKIRANAHKNISLQPERKIVFSPPPFNFPFSGRNLFPQNAPSKEKSCGNKQKLVHPGKANSSAPFPQRPQARRQAFTARNAYFKYPAKFSGAALFCIMSEAIFSADGLPLHCLHQYTALCGSLGAFTPLQ